MTVNQKSESQIGSSQIKKNKRKNIYKGPKAEKSSSTHQKKSGMINRDYLMENMIKIEGFVLRAMGAIEDI